MTTGHRVLVAALPAVPLPSTEGLDVFQLAADGAPAAVLAVAQPDVVLVDPSWPAGAKLLRALRDDASGPQPIFVLCAASLEQVAPLGVPLACALVGPLGPAVLREVVAAVTRPRQVSPAATAGVTTLGLPMPQGLARAAEAFTAGYGVHESLIAVRVAGRPTVVAHPASASESAGPNLLRLAELSSALRAPLVIAGEGQSLTLLAAPLERGGAGRDGYAILATRDVCAWAADAVLALVVAGQRLATELAWSAAFERIRVERDQFRQGALTDPLTGAWTRHALEQALPGELAAARRRLEKVSLVAFDPRGLREINQKHGHHAGDEALRLIAQATRAALRTADTIVRYTGDVFLVLLPSTREIDALRTVDRLRTVLERASTETLHLECTWGVAELSPDDEQGARGIELVLRALDTAKRQRRVVHVAQNDDAGGQDRLVGLDSGTLLGGAYQVLHEIARGAMGIVYRAEDLSLSRQVALKLLRRDLAADPEFVARFRREAATLASLRHDHLVQVYAFGAEGDDLFFVMELIEGESLEALIGRWNDREEFMPLPEVVRLLRGVGGTIDLMSRAGMAHRDVKPANILIERDTGRAVLADVGIAKRFGGEGDAAGTPGFSPPEALTSRGEHPSGDVYSLAATAYAMLTGRAPFPGHTIEVVLTKQLVTGAELASSVRPVLGDGVDRVFARALSATPEDRYPTGEQLVTALERALDAIAVDLASDSVELSPLRERQPDDAGAVTAATWHQAIARGPTLQSAAVELSRGLWFRALSRVLGVREAAGVIAAISRKDADLGRALGPATAPDSWLPRTLFERMLATIGAQGRDLGRVAGELGAVAARDFLPRLLGAAPAQLGVTRLCAALPALWGQYHSWGKLEAALDGGVLTVTLHDGALTRPVALTLSGLLRGAIALAGGSARETELVIDAPGCRIQLAVSDAAPPLAAPTTS